MRRYRCKLDDVKETVAADYQAGDNLASLSEKYRCSQYTVHQCLIRQGIQLRRMGRKRVHALNEDYFAELTEESCYWAGFLAGDGCITRGDTVALVLSETDAGHVELFAKCLGYTGPIESIPAYEHTDPSGYVWRSKAQVRCTIRSTKLASSLLLFGVTEKKSLTLQPWHCTDDRLQSAYFRGLVDADGSLIVVQKDGKTPLYHLRLTGTKAVGQALLDYLSARITGFHRKVDWKPKPRHGGRVYEASVGGRGLAIAAVKILYGNATIALPRKLEIAKQIMADEPVKADWSHVTSKMLYDLHEQTGSWDAVAERLGMSRTTPYRILRQLARDGKQ